MGSVQTSLKEENVKRQLSELTTTIVFVKVA
jgi:hypothetical protein